MLRALLLLSAWVPAAAQQLRGSSSGRGDVVVPVGGGGEDVRSTSKFFVWLSDIHVDPFYGSEGQQCNSTRHPPEQLAANLFGTMGCDPPYALMESASAAAAEAVGGSAEFVLFTGDFVRHGQSSMPEPEADVLGTIANVSSILGQAFPDLLGKFHIVAGALGNDDSPQDYYLNITTNMPSNPWLTQVGETFLRERALAPEFEGLYDYGGYFERQLGGLTILTINTIIYSVNHWPVAEELPEDPFLQFSWLRERLQHAAREKRAVWIMGHIPPGMETYHYTELWHPQYMEAYLALVQDPELGAVVAAQLFGHLHADEFRLLPQPPAGSGPILLTGALSPIYDNNPSFRVVEYDSVSGRLLNYSVYYANMTEGSQEPQWSLGYSALPSYPTLASSAAVLEEAAGPGHLSGASYRSLAEKLAEGGEEWDTYVNWYKTRIPNALDRCAGTEADEKQACISSYVCALVIGSQPDYEACANSTSPVAWFDELAIAADAASHARPHDGQTLIVSLIATLMLACSLGALA
jgi:sphingomyelin phosphodiesterase acid-like 3